MLKHRASSQTFADLFYEGHFNTCLLHKLLESGQFNHIMASKNYVLMNSDYIYKTNFTDISRYAMKYRYLQEPNSYGTIF